MKKLLIALGMSAAALVPGGALAAGHQTVILRPPASLHNMAVEHAMGTAKLTFTAHDVGIKISVSHLPAASALHEKAYLVWLVNGRKWTHVGKLTFHSGMAGLNAMPMVTKFTKIAIYAQPSANEMDPMGIKVLTGSVMHH